MVVAVCCYCYCCRCCCYRACHEWRAWRAVTLSKLPYHDRCSCCGAAGVGSGLGFALLLGAAPGVRALENKKAQKGKERVLFPSCLSLLLGKEHGPDQIEGNNQNSNSSSFLRLLNLDSHALLTQSTPIRPTDARTHHTAPSCYALSCQLQAFAWAGAFILSSSSPWPVEHEL